MSILLTSSDVSRTVDPHETLAVSPSQRLTAGSVEEEAKFNSNTNKQSFRAASQCIFNMHQYLGLNLHVASGFGAVCTFPRCCCLFYEDNKGLNVCPLQSVTVQTDTLH